MLYFSERALNEIEDASFTSSHASAASVSKWVTFGRSRSLDLSPGATDRVDFALRRSRKKGRRVITNLARRLAPGTLIDVRVAQLRVGVMPFLRLGKRGESPYSDGVRTFWAQALLAQRGGRLKSKTCSELIMLGSLDNVVNGAWNLDAEESLKIGHDYPSEPSAIVRLVQTTHELNDRATNKHARDIERAQIIDPGDGALFASGETKRASKTSALSEPGYVATWERRAPLRTARIVAIVNDVSYQPTDLDDDEDRDRIVLARPVLVEDLT